MDKGTRGLGPSQLGRKEPRTVDQANEASMRMTGEDV